MDSLWRNTLDSSQAVKQVELATRFPSDNAQDMEFSPSSGLIWGWEREPKSVGISMQISKYYLLPQPLASFFYIARTAFFTEHDY